MNKNSSHFLSGATSHNGYLNHRSSRAFQYPFLDRSPALPNAPQHPTISGFFSCWLLLSFVAYCTPSIHRTPHSIKYKVFCESWELLNGAVLFVSSVLLHRVPRDLLHWVVNNMASLYSHLVEVITEYPVWSVIKQITFHKTVLLSLNASDLCTCQRLA